MKPLFAICFLLVFSSSVFGQNEEWVRHLGSSDFVWTQNVHAHDNGTTYIIGNYNQEVCIDDDQSNYNCFYNDITGIPNSSNTFLAALDENGQFLWGNFLPLWDTGNGLFYNYEIKIDSDPSGSIFLLGNLNDTIDAVFKDGNTLSFVPGPYKSCLLLKLDTMGNFLSSYQFDGTIAGHTLDVVDEEIIITGHHGLGSAGYFADFDLGSTNYVYNEPGMFLMKLDDQFHLQWLRHVEGDVRAKDAAVDADGNIIITGEFRGDQVDFKGYGSPNYLSSRQTEVFDGFLLKFDGVGFFQWARSTLFTNYV